MRWCTRGAETFCALLRLSLHLANFTEGTTTKPPAGPGRAEFLRNIRTFPQEDQTGPIDAS
jgi:hypothetical protein